MIPNPVKPMSRDFVRRGLFVASIFRGQVGDHHVVRAPAPVMRTNMEHRSMIVSGRWKMVHTPDGVAPFSDWAAGVSTIQRPDFPAAGLYISECVEPTLYICLQRGARNRGFFCKYLFNEISPFTLPVSGVLVMGSGKVIGPVNVDGIPVSVSGVSVIHAKRGDALLTPVEPVTGIIGYIG